MKSIRLAGFLAVALVFSCGRRGANALDSGQVSGNVYDETNAPIPGATVTLTKQRDTAASRVTVTGASGSFQVSRRLRPGTTTCLSSWRASTLSK